MVKMDFRKLYAKFLSPYGYVYCKKINYFIKIINDELISFIGYRVYPGSVLEEKSFVPVGGCVSIYFTTLSKEGFQTNECELFSFFRKKNKNAKYPSCQYAYKRHDGDELRCKIEESFMSVDEYILPIINNIKNLNDYIDYNMGYSKKMSRCDLFAGDSLVLIKANNHDDFMNYYCEALERFKELFNKGIVGKSVEEEKIDLYQGIVEGIAKSRDKVYADPELYKRALEEADRRKKENTELLRSYGIDI